jgi:hypothetical protein
MGELSKLKTLDAFMLESKEYDKPILEKRGSELPLADAVDEINKKLTSFGISNVSITTKQMKSIKPNKNGDLALSLDKIKIDPKSLGVLAPVFDKIDLVITTIYNEANQAMVLVLDYKWSHPSGSNGYSIRDSFWNGKWVGY